MPDLTNEEIRGYLTRDLATDDEVIATLKKIIANPQPKIKNGKVVVDADGKPVPNESVRRRAESQLRKFEADRAKVQRMLDSLG